MWFEVRGTRAGSAWGSLLVLGVEQSRTQNQFGVLVFAKVDCVRLMVSVSYQDECVLSAQWHFHWLGRMTFSRAHTAPFPYLQGNKRHCHWCGSHTECGYDHWFILVIEVKLIYSVYAEVPGSFVWLSHLTDPLSTLRTAQPWRQLPTEHAQWDQGSTNVTWERDKCFE